MDGGCRQGGGHQALIRRLLRRQHHERPHLFGYRQVGTTAKQRRFVELVEGYAGLCIYDRQRDADNSTHGDVGWRKRGRETYEEAGILVPRQGDSERREEDEERQEPVFLIAPSAIPIYKCHRRTPTARRREGCRRLSHLADEEGNQEPVDIRQGDDRRGARTQRGTQTCCRLCEEPKGIHHIQGGHGQIL